MTATDRPVRVRPPGIRAWGMLILSEAKSLVRDYASLLLPLGLPLLVLVTSAGIASAEPIGDTGFTAFEFFVLPIVLTMVFAYIGLLNMPTYLSHYRRSGILRRLGATPASPIMVLASQVIVSALLSLVGIVLALAAAFLLFDAVAPANTFAVAGACVLAMVTMYSIGMVVAALAPTTNSAIAFGVILFLALGALGGMFGGRGALPDALQPISDALPFGASADLLAASWTGQPVDPMTVVPLLCVIAISSLVSLVFFRWE